MRSFLESLFRLNIWPVLFALPNRTCLCSNRMIDLMTNRRGCNYFILYVLYREQSYRLCSGMVDEASCHQVIMLGTEIPDPRKLGTQSR